MMDYNIYMLRVWKEEGKQNPNPLRVSIENPNSGTRVGFTDWESLIAYLNRQTVDRKKPIAIR
ncbi:MAG: hypothetical protein KC419_15355 [Anaerolineales bacterium]|nr:hypothetical protein [Anaerolineales bacterium]MCA9929860.1 hypothetical protein [Anaerolineales bacterium]